MKITLMGLEFSLENLGCEALTLSFLTILKEAIRANDISSDDVYVTAIVYRTNISDEAREIFPNIEAINISPKQKAFWKSCKSAFNESDFIFDFTMGDSFSDIYGMKRFTVGSVLKKMAAKSKGCFVLGPQTYGPFKNIFAKSYAKRIILKADYVFTRDKLSQDYVEQFCNRVPELTTDVAFALPFERDIEVIDKTKVGINVSGLLWRGGYNQKNQFNLEVDYPTYIRGVIDCLIKDEKYQIYLIPHVISQGESIDSDTWVSEELHKQYPHTILCGNIESCIDAKNIISRMDVFVGARMHSTIAAFSSGVAVIPFSYSRKFEGLYESLEYPYVISATKLSTEEAIRDTVSYIKQYELLDESVEKSMVKVKQKQDEFCQRISKIIMEKRNEK